MSKFLENSGNHYVPNAVASCNYLNFAEIRAKFQENFIDEASNLREIQMNFKNIMKLSRRSAKNCEKLQDFSLEKSKRMLIL